MSDFKLTRTLAQGVEVTFQLTTEDVRFRLETQNILGQLGGNELLESFIKAEVLIEATNDERHHLWQKYNEKGFPNNHESSAHLILGNFAGIPVQIYLYFYNINNIKVCFVEPNESIVIDHRMIDDFLTLAKPLVRKKYTKDFVMPKNP